MFKIFVTTIILVTILAFSLAYFKSNIVPVLYSTCDAEVRVLGTNCINEATFIVVNEEYDYNDLFTVTNDDNNNVTMIVANSVKINRMARDIAMLVQTNLDEIGDYQVTIPAGTFTGLSLLIGLGTPISISITPIGTAYCDFVSEFVSAGINQTVHKIYIDIYVNLLVALPVEDLDITIKSEILICENLIVGAVPNTYLTMGSNISSINLVP